MLRVLPVSGVKRTVHLRVLLQASGGADGADKGRKKNIFESDAFVSSRGRPVHA